MPCSPIYQHLYEILKTKNVDANTQTTKAAAASVSNKKMDTDKEKPGYDLSQNMAQQNFDLKLVFLCTKKCTGNLSLLHEIEIEFNFWKIESINFRLIKLPSNIKS